MPLSRDRFAGVRSIAKFNWDQLAAGAGFVVVSFAIASRTGGRTRALCATAGVAGLGALTSALGVSHLVYDRSTLYSLEWLDTVPPDSRVLAVTAGYDEVSASLADHSALASIDVLDFFDPTRQTERSLGRARRRQPAQADTRVRNVGKPTSPNLYDRVVLFMSLHEIRERDERAGFLGMIRKSLAPDGDVVVVEHLRDVPNTIAFSAGVRHFFSAREWRGVFDQADLSVMRSTKVTPFVSVFWLR